MMKILCLLIILANICVFLWEYRQGAFSAQPKLAEQMTLPGTEPIILIDENPENSANHTLSGRQ